VTLTTALAPTLSRLLAIICTGSLGVWFSSATAQRLKLLQEVDSPTLLLSQALSFSLSQVHDGFTYAATAADKAAVAQALEKAAQFRKAAEQLALQPGSAETSKALQTLFDTYTRAAQQVVSALLGDANSGGADPAASAERMRSAHAALLQQLSALKSQSQQSLAAGIAAAEASVRHGLIAGLVGVVVVLAVSLAVGRQATQEVLREVGGSPAYAKSIVQNIAAGALQTPITLRAADSSSLLFAMRGMQTQLSSLIGDVHRCAASIDTSSSAIADGNSDLSQRAARQTEELRAASARMDQLTLSVGKNADQSQQANTLARSASQAAEVGAQEVGQVVQTMTEILHSSKRISEITATIDSIAFRTNLLALNAAVEAARAGEQGRGFAVVASEVRGLAQGAAVAAREIKGLITDSSQRIQQGVQQVQAAGTSISHLVDAVKGVGQLMADISGATAEQRADIEQVNRVVSQLNMNTQQDAELAAKANAASGSLQVVAARLTETVSVFAAATPGAPA
jgi:methyl-accepting chemotaxis protein